MDSSISTSAYVLIASQAFEPLHDTMEQISLSTQLKSSVGCANGPDTTTGRSAHQISTQRYAPHTWGPWTHQYGAVAYRPATPEQRGTSEPQSPFHRYAFPAGRHNFRRLPLPITAVAAAAAARDSGCGTGIPGGGARPPGNDHLSARPLAQAAVTATHRVGRALH